MYSRFIYRLMCLLSVLYIMHLNVWVSLASFISSVHAYLQVRIRWIYIFSEIVISPGEFAIIEHTWPMKYWKHHMLFFQLFFLLLATIQGTQQNKLILFCKSFNVTMSALFLFKRKKWCILSGKVSKFLYIFFTCGRLIPFNKQK